MSSDRADVIHSTAAKQASWESLDRLKFGFPNTGEQLFAENKGVGGSYQLNLGQSGLLSGGLIDRDHGAGA
ncbi:MAG TPA: hypothetical protein DEF45_17595 [Rhodopirellula sp.]|nr:hypothetical protein [Rhodopirellula sp.]